MKKLIVILFCFVVFCVLINEEKKIIIPKNAIRFRIIANSNSVNDQEMKIKIKKDVEKELYKIIENSNDIGSAREKISNNLYKIDNILDDYNVNYNINYGYNYFPKKEYKGITYNEGNYESLVITLGEGAGNNWWCVLFPPLCLLDEDDNIKDIEYKVFAKKLINKLK